MKRIKSLLLSLSCLLFLAVPAFGPSLVFAAPAPSPTDPAAASVCDAIKCDEAQGPSVGNILKVVLNVLTFLVGFAAVVMIIVNAFRFVASGGDSSKVASARTGIVYALVGLAIAALAQVMVHFVLNQVNGSNAPVSKPTAAQCKANPKLAGCPKT